MIVTLFAKYAGLFRFEQQSWPQQVRIHQQLPPAMVDALFLSAVSSLREQPILLSSKKVRERCSAHRRKIESDLSHNGVSDA